MMFGLGRNNLNIRNVYLPAWSLVGPNTSTMKNLSAVFSLCLLSLLSSAQSTRFYQDPDARFKEAKAYFQKEQYSLAYPIFRELRQSLRETDRANNAITEQEVRYYTLVCGLKQNEGPAEPESISYIRAEKNNARTGQLSYHLAEYYFRQERFADALSYYDKAGIANLSNRELADMKFHQGYAHFNLQQFAKAKPLFNSIRMMPEDPHYRDASYYYGFLAFRDGQYSEAQESFKVVENEPAYGTVVPYYIAQIYYLQGKKEQAITYVKDKLKTGANTQYYDLELKQLIGHAHFEKGEYALALPYLADYVARNQKVRREDLYELSYCYYQTGNLPRAIEGFRQLSGKEDSLSQHAMYLLGDAYLKTGQKSSARNAFLFCSSNSSHAGQKEISRFQYAKLSYELGYQDEALNSLNTFLADYPSSAYNAEARELMVDLLAKTNNYRDAQALLEAMEKPSENTRRIYPRILLGRAMELINDGRLAEADGLLTKLMNLPGNTPVLPFAYFWKGELGYRFNQLDTAIKYYQLYAGAGSPASGEANANNVRYNLGYAYLRKENYPVALSYFEPLGRGAALASPAFVQDAYIRTADCYFMQRDYTKARGMYDNVIKYSWPAEDYATFQLAMLAGVRSAKDKISLMNNMIRKFPQSSLVTDANMEIANTYMGDEQFREAVPYLASVIRTSGNASLVPQAYLKMGTAYYNINNNAEALKYFRELISKYPNAPEAEDALDNVKLIYVEDGQPDAYAALMRELGRPLSVSTEDSLSYTVAENLYDDQKLNEALTAFSNYLQRFPNGAYVLDAQFNRAEIYFGRKDWRNALADYEAVAARSPNKYAERAILAAARLSFFELKDYNRAEGLYTQLKQVASGQENKLEAMRGLLRSQYQLQKWEAAVENARELTAAKGSSADDKALANMAIGKSAAIGGQHDQAIAAFRQVIQQNKAALAAEARYEIAQSLLQLNRLNDAEKAAFETINKSGSYDYWITKAYILLGEIYFRQKDYFNAKATLQSVVDHTLNPELKAEAQTKLATVTEEEARNSKVNN